jgi:hypothetical protein
MAFEDGVFATFCDDVIQNEKKSKEAGYPVFDESRLFIKIVIPNSIDDVYRPANDADKQRFPLSYEAYKRGVEFPDEGLPIMHCPQFTTSEVKLLNAVNVKTVEQLAELPDSGLHRLGPGGQGLKNRAKKFLDTAGENTILKEKIRKLERKIEELTASSNDKPAVRRPKKLKVSSA